VALDAAFLFVGKSQLEGGELACLFFFFVQTFFFGFVGLLAFRCVEVEPLV